MQWVGADFGGWLLGWSVGCVQSWSHGLPKGLQLSAVALQPAEVGSSAAQSTCQGQLACMATGVSPARTVREASMQ